ncbi:MAG: NAD-dependent epimerase/dehydratase family protein [Bacteroidetes bacterium]|nr:NAD-dependent epimerase/dehydratase family protein [Bacteroidota bacterium]MDA1121302.1 NAD-dependent epimerase/dehydratase family protein [Bacteroidota bacterium]
MDIIITGGGGFVGYNLAVFLKKAIPNARITCLDNLKRRGSELNLPVLKQLDIDFVHGDIRNPEDLYVIKEADFIIDASAEPSVLAGITSPAYPVINTNLNGTIHLLELTRKLKSKFIFLSTSRVYPIKALNAIAWHEDETRFSLSREQTMEGVTEKGINENFSLKGSRSFYGATKLASELFIEEYQPYGGVEAVVNRCGVISGPGQMGKVDQGVMTLWVARHYWKRELSYLGFEGSGKQVRDILHIDDLCQLILFQIQNFEHVSGHLFNVGGGKEHSISLLELTNICELVTGNRIHFKKVKANREADIRTYITDNTMVNSVTGWMPKRSVDSNVADIFQWILSNEANLKAVLDQ